MKIENSALNRKLGNLSPTILVAILAQLADMVTFMLNYGPTRPELNPIMAVLATYGVWVAIPFKIVIIGIMFWGINFIKDKPTWPIVLLFTISGIIGTLGNIGVLHV